MFILKIILIVITTIVLILAIKEEICDRTSTNVLTVGFFLLYLIYLICS